MQTDPRYSNRRRPRILIADTNRWPLSPRLALSLASAGADVFGLCPVQGHGLRKTSAVKQVFDLGAPSPLQDIIRAIRACDPDIVIPACERTVSMLHALHGQLVEASELHRLIESSLGRPSSFSVIDARCALLQVAQEEGIRVPETVALNEIEDIAKAEQAFQYPWVMKSDGTWGGAGVCVVHSRREARKAFQRLNGLFRLSRSLKRYIVNRDPFGLYQWRSGEPKVISAHSYISGRPANCAALCWKGEVHALIAVEVVAAAGVTGPASVVRLFENAYISNAARRLAARLGLSGYIGLDFLVEEGKPACLIELNPRPAPPCYLELGKDRDLGAALIACLTHEEVRERESVTRAQTIVYLPDSARSSHNYPPTWYRDYPQGEEALIAELRNPYPDRTLLFRLVRCWDRMLHRVAAGEDAAIENSGEMSASQKARI